MKKKKVDWLARFERQVLLPLAALGLTATVVWAIYEAYKPWSIINW